MDTLEILKIYAQNPAAELNKRMPQEIIAALLGANNQMLKAAIIQNGGELIISPEAFYKMFQNMEHVVASSDDSGSVKLSLAAKESVEHSEIELLPL